MCRMFSASLVLHIDRALDNEDVPGINFRLEQFLEPQLAGVG